MVSSFTGISIQQRLRVYVQSLVTITCILLLFPNFIRGLSLQGSDVCQKCNIENRELSEIFQKKVIQDVRKKCVYVKEFLRCAEPLESKCRQDLNFQGALTLMRSFREERKCASLNISLDEELNRTKGIIHDTEGNKECPNPDFGPVYKICGLFGDPHLRTFSDERHTCSVPGAWPLFANRYLTVQVTNIPLENSSRATATSKVTVIVRGLKRKCIEEKTYQARSYSLPAHFSDGTKSSDNKDCPTKIKKFKKGKRILIHICPLKTRIIIRQVGKYLTVHMRVPEELTQRRTIGLCQRGCPKIEQMNLDKMNRIDKIIASLYKERKLSTRVRRQRQERARRLCRAAKVRGFYYKSCLFDMMTSNDASFVRAARKAMKDFRTINKDDKGYPIVNETVRDFWTGPIKRARTTVKTMDTKIVTPSSGYGSVKKSSLSLLLMVLLMTMLQVVW